MSAVAYGDPVVIVTQPRWWTGPLFALLLLGTLTVRAIAVYRSVRSAQDSVNADRPAAPAEVLKPLLAKRFMPPSETTLLTLPGGAASLFDAGSAAALAPLLEEALPGDPSLFTSIILYLDHAETTARDPSDAMQTVHTTWRMTGSTEDGNEQETPNVTKSLFTVDDVNWDIIPSLVAVAPARTGGQAVTSVVVQRWGFDPTFPMRILVNVDDTKFIEATTDGRVLLAVP